MRALYHVYGSMKSSIVNRLRVVLSFLENASKMAGSPRRSTPMRLLFFSFFLALPSSQAAQGGSVAIVGATGAIGRALARRCVAAGTRPWLIGRDLSKLQALSAECGGAPFSVIDVMALDTIVSGLNGQVPADCKGFAYCVGDIVLKPFKRAAPADFLNCFSLHVVGAIEVLKVVEPALKKNGGSVVLFSSGAAGVHESRSRVLCQGRDRGPDACPRR